MSFFIYMDKIDLKLLMIMHIMVLRPIDRCRYFWYLMSIVGYMRFCDVTEREEQIVIVLLRNPDVWMTRRELARRLGLKKTPYLIDIVDRLVDRGVIDRQLGSWGGFSCWFFTTKPEVVQKFIMIPVKEWMYEWSIRNGED